VPPGSAHSYDQHTILTSTRPSASISKISFSSTDSGSGLNYVPSKLSELGLGSSDEESKVKTTKETKKKKKKRRKNKKNKKKKERNDEIGRVAKKDPMIVMMGNSAMNRGIGNIAMRRYTVSGVIRLLARLLIELRALQPTEELKKNLTFYEALHPSQYDNFIHAVFAVCKEESVEEAEQDEQIETEPAKLQAPSNAIKLSYYIQKLCRMKIQLSIVSENRVVGEENRKATKRFMDKYKASWEVDVKKRARHVLRERKLNAMTELPDQINTEKVHQVTFRGN